ncbi:hypothetical protein [Halobacterium sp. BOL4-2]|uniref:hypothetical protein n=1 Tax=Halobacterium sp. BOL4-2 TaxID=2810537 RepID=UPI0019642536|nr:hypothetical protein [Halobacterium sp. BOL4-2]QRY26362.1 hypothetical protein JRZ79_13005 [Halobacterium sp. BOL4-2]
MAENPAATVSLEFSLELETDPLGATLEVAVPDANSDEARQAFLDSAESALVGASGNLISQCVAEAHDNLASYASSQGYDIGFLENEFAGVEVDRGQRSLTVEWSWDSELASYYEFGVAPHTIRGDPLHFYWAAKDQWIQTDEVNWGSETGGIPESRWVRDSLHWLRREVAQT